MPEIFNIKKVKSKFKKPADKPTGMKDPSAPLDSEKSPETKEKPASETVDIKNPLGLFTTFLKNPAGISFAAQDAGEEIAIFLRRHFASNIPWIVSTFVLILTPILIGFILHTTRVRLNILPSNFVLVFTVFYYFATFGFAFSNFLTWFFTIGMITTKRAVDIDFVNVSSIHFASADLGDIIDAKYTQDGFFQSFFDYGDVSIAIQTPQEKLLFEKSPKPSEVANLIDDLTGHKPNV